MAITYSGSITFQHGEERAIMRLPVASSLDALGTFAEDIAHWTNAAVIEYSLTQAVTIDPELQSPSDGLYSGLDEYAMLLFHGDPAKTRSKNFVIPAPFIAIFDESGLKVTTEAGNALAEAYSRLTGGEEEFVFIRGRYKNN
jgi:hypothetical protein